MAKEVIRGLSLLLGQLKLAAHINAVGFEEQADEVESTNGASAGWRELEQGIRRAELSVEAMLESAENPHKTLRDLFVAATGVPFSATKTYPPASGDRAWFQKVVELRIGKMLQIGQLWRASLGFGDQSPAVYGRCLDRVDAATSSGNGTELNLGVQVQATERLWVATHVIRLTGTSPELDLVLKSDDPGFVSPTTRYTLPAFTAVGSDIAYVDGPITDTAWRIDRTLSGATPEAEYLVFIGIAPKV